MKILETLFLSFLGLTFLILILLLLISIPFAFYDSFYIIPAVEEKANQDCQEQGFDFYEDYSRIGILSKEPIAIICKYVDQYRNIDLNINGGENE